MIEFFLMRDKKISNAQQNITLKQFLRFSLHNVFFPSLVEFYCFFFRRFPIISVLT